MQPAGAYMDQIPAGARPPTANPPAVKITPNTGPVAQRPPPPGLYVQVASVGDQDQAIRAGLEVSQRLGANRPPFIRGVAATVQGQPRIHMFAGPFADEGVARRFCALAVPGQACLLHVFESAPAAQTKGPTAAGPQGKGD